MRASGNNSLHVEFTWRLNGLMEKTVIKGVEEGRIPAKAPTRTFTHLGVPCKGAL